LRGDDALRESVNAGVKNEIDTQRGNFSVAPVGVERLEIIGPPAPSPVQPDIGISKIITSIRRDAEIFDFQDEKLTEV